MQRRRVSLLFAALALGLASVVPLTQTALAAPGVESHASSAGQVHAQNVCPPAPSAGWATCYAKVLVTPLRGNGHGGGKPTTTQGALTPNDLQVAYGLKTAISKMSGHPTVAIVDAYGYPNLESDLATYRSTYNLPACTSDSGCLTVMNQDGLTGAKNLPAFNLGWAQEQALDVDTVSAICPACDILVVQADSATFADLGAAVEQAAIHSDVVAISNSYGGSDAPDAVYGTPYNHPGIAVTASTGDSGYQRGGSFPADSAYVTAVGGTSLKLKDAGTSNVSVSAETAWSGSGSGCSAYNSAVAPATTDTGCAHRAIADVSAAADPAYGGLNVYFPTSSSKATWAQVGGTSESSPIIASVFALAGSGWTSHATYSNAYLYSHSSSLNDITSGSNGHCPKSTSQWCRAGTGWDGPTGLGTPNGIGAF